MDVDERAHPPSLDRAALRDHFARIMKQRDAAVPFERFESASVRSDGHRLHLDVIATEAGASTVVFVPGTSVYGLIFGDFLAALADAGLNVVSVDPRGHGRSEGPRGCYTIAELVRDARAAVRYARERFGARVYLAGSSQGGIVTLYAAATDEPLAGAICHNVADLGRPERFRMSAHPRLTRLASPLVRAAGAIAPHASFDISRYLALLSRRGDPTHRAVLERLASDPLALRRMYLRSLASLAYARPPRPLEQITTPVLVLHGTADRIFPRDYVEGIYRRLTCAKEIRMYEGRDHFLLTDRPERVVPDVRDWIHALER